jgi:hypothetical protein
MDGLYQGLYFRTIRDYEMEIVSGNLDRWIVLNFVRKEG